VRIPIFLVSQANYAKFCFYFCFLINLLVNSRIHKVYQIRGLKSWKNTHLIQEREIIINKIKFLMISAVFTVTIKVWENDFFILKIRSFPSTGCVNRNCLFAVHNLRTFNLGVNFSFVYSLVFLDRAKV